MTRNTEPQPAKVPLAQQAGTALPHADHPLWRWAKPSAWTVRMLTTLIQGVEGDRWFRLFDKVFSERNLLAAFQQVARNDEAPGVDHVTTSEFERQLPDSVWELSDRLKSGTFQPQCIRRVHIPKPGTNETRPLGIPTVRDRVVQAAIVNVIEPIFERDFAEQSYGFRPGRGCKDALRRVDELLKAGYTHVVDADLKGYFDAIPHDRLMDRLKTKIADGRRGRMECRRDATDGVGLGKPASPFHPPAAVLSLIESFLKANILDGLEEWTPTAGAPQGAVLSPLLSNEYLDPLDHLLAASGFQMVRYADDFVVLCRTAEAATQALDLIQTWVSENGLTLHPAKTRLVDAAQEGFDFLGYHFERDQHWPRQKSLQKLKDSLRAKTRRNSGSSLDRIIATVNRTLRGWFAYLQHSTRRSEYRGLDGWLRRRLRSLLRRRQGNLGHGHTARDCFTWPNRFFAAHGLYSLATAHAAACQSSLR